MSLEGQTALITGAGGMHGIGRSVAIGLAQMGADIVVTDIRKPEKDLPEEEVAAGWKGIESVSAEIETTGRRCIALYADISQENEIQGLIEETVKRLGKLHIIVNNARAAIGGDRESVVDLDSREWDRVMSVNLRGAYLCCKYAAKQMIKQNDGGRIINMSSLAGKRGSPKRSAYSASKFGLLGLTQSLAHELAPHHITVNAICPGAVDTHRVSNHERDLAIQEGTTVEEIRKRILSKVADTIPLKRVATSEDVAAVAVFLASPAAGYLTGESINVAGGAFMQ